MDSQIKETDPCKNYGKSSSGQESMKREKNAKVQCAKNSPRHVKTVKIALAEKIHDRKHGKLEAKELSSSAPRDSRSFISNHQGGAESKDRRCGQRRAKPGRRQMQTPSRVEWTCLKPAAAESQGPLVVHDGRFCVGPRIHSILGKHLSEFCLQAPPLRTFKGVNFSAHITEVVMCGQILVFSVFFAHVPLGFFESAALK